MRVYNKLRLHEGLILRPALNQMESLKRAVQKENPAMLEINRAIAQAAEQNHKISILQSNGLLDSDACSAKLASLEAQLTRLRTKRKALLKNDDIGETAEVLRQVIDILNQGPERLDRFDAELFADLVEKIIAEPGHRLRFQFYSGFELAEQLYEDGT